MGLDLYNNKDKIIVDHIDGDRSNNRLNNLRVTKKLKNPINCKKYKNNKSGVIGVYWNSRLEKWCASIGINKKIIHLGVFEVFEDAVEERLKAEKEYFGEFKRDKAYE